ncbi:MAG: tetratricopeptide repeat protein [Methylococcales bacterium]
MNTFNVTARETLDALYAQTDVLQEGFENIARQVMEQQRVLREIANILRRPYETKVLELLNEADEALENGMKASGRDQEEEFKDATRLLRDVLENPIGSRNYVAWFQTGWLNWKFKNNLAEAEESFYQAARLSGPKADLYHAKSLRHLAYMQYLRGQYAEAYDSIHKALRITPNDHGTMYDAARYAAKTGREREAFELLDKCIDLQPETTITMFSEEDFVS